jgi:hypothetical protein
LHVINKLEENITEKDPINALKDTFIYEKRYKNSIKVLVSTDNLSPFLNIGDWVCGILYDPNKFSNLKNQLSIIIHAKIPFKKICFVDLMKNGTFKIRYKFNSKKIERLQQDEIKYIAPIFLIRKSKEYRTINRHNQLNC